jgi:hypothetical protein
LQPYPTRQLSVANEGENGLNLQNPGPVLQFCDSLNLVKYVSAVEFYLNIAQFGLNKTNINRTKIKFTENSKQA